MFKRHFFLKLIVVALVVVLGLYVIAYAAGGADDPLVSLSYINQTVIPSLKDQLNALVGTAKDELGESIDNTLDEFRDNISVQSVANALNIGDDEATASSGDGYISVTLLDGEKLSLSTGCELLLVEGSAVCGGTLSDTTSGTVLSDGQLEANHLYLATEDMAVVASTQCRFLIKGEYSAS